MKRFKVLVLEHSSNLRYLLDHGLSQSPHLMVVAVASDPYEARNQIVQHDPHVLVMGLDFPKMDGVEFIGILMEHWPLPIVVLSNLSQDQCQHRLHPVASPDLWYFCQPDLEKTLSHNLFQLAQLVQQACTTPEAAPLSPVFSSKKVIAIGASTGGTEAVRSVLTELPSGLPGILVVQHMAEGFTAMFAQRMNELCGKLHVQEAYDGAHIKQGSVLLAPGNQHMVLDGNLQQVRLHNGPKVARHRPSVDVLFHSVAEVVGKQAIGVILTGMGNDGAQGMLAMRQAHARTIAQNEESCVVYGMPREAVRLGAVEIQVPLPQIASQITKFV